MRARSSSLESRAAVALKTRLIVAKIFDLQDEIALPKAVSLRNLRSTMLVVLTCAIERNYGGMPTGKMRSMNASRIQQFRGWLVPLLVAVVMALPFFVIAGFLTGAQTDIGQIMSPETPAESLGLIIYGAAGLSIAARLNPSIVGNVTAVQNITGAVRRTGD